MDKTYYFVVEPGGVEDGPYQLPEIARRVATGMVSQQASLMRAGETTATPIADIAHVLQPLARRPSGTTPPPAQQYAPTVFAPIEAAAVEAAPLPPPPAAPVPQAPYALAPYVPQPAPKPASPPAGGIKKWPFAVGAGVLVVGGIAIAAKLAPSKSVEVNDSMVRVSTPSGTGAGFLIDGPDDSVYVATANHVVDRGERVLVERDVPITDKKVYVEAYPETEIVAADADSDLAIIRIKNVDAKRFKRLVLAKEPVKDVTIHSYGYPGSSLAKHAGLVSKDGKVLSLVRFPAYDDRYARIVRDNAVDGLLVSTDLEPGFSGGPTTNEAGEVVGINVTKDHAHVGQNGAVSVVALRSLLDSVKPASDTADPTPDQITALLKRIQSDYLLLPIEERSRARETEFLSAGDLPTLRRFVGEVRREERDTDTAYNSKVHMSGQAALGIYFARFPGKLLETYRAPSTMAPLDACELGSRRLGGFLLDDERKATTGFEACDELALRPLAWDLAAATLQWDGKEKDYTVSKIERMDDDGKIYRVSVRVAGATNLFELWIGMDRRMPRLKLFDPTENLYAISSARPTGSMHGTWARKQPRVTDDIDKEAEVEGDETLAISISDDHKVSIRSVVTQRYYVAGKRQVAFKCDHKNTIETGVLQSFSGTLENGVIVALPDKPAEAIGADAGSCESSQHPDRVVAMKLVGDQLTLYRTDGIAYPTTLQFARQ